MSKVIIIGAGAMGSAFAFPCLDRNHDTTVIGTHLEDKFIDELKSDNNFHSALKVNIPKSINISKFEKFDSILKTKTDLIVLAISSKGIEWIAEQLPRVFKDLELPPLLILTKGLSVNQNKYELLVDKLERLLNSNGILKTNISAVGGPCLAAGLANKVHSSVVIANKDIKIAKKISELLNTNYYHTSYSDDLIGVEVCAATKNIYSMLIGASEGLSSKSLDNEIKKKYFLNTAASLAYKAVAEMKSLTRKLNGKEESAYGLAGLGDLYVSSAGGRNSKMGYYLGQGHLFKEAKEKFMKDITVEGADLAQEIGPKILKEFEEKEFPLLFSVIKCICNNQKLEINW